MLQIILVRYTNPEFYKQFWKTYIHPSRYQHRLTTPTQPITAQDLRITVLRIVGLYPEVIPLVLIFSLFLSDFIIDKVRAHSLLFCGGILFFVNLFLNLIIRSVTKMCSNRRTGAGRSGFYPSFHAQSAFSFAVFLEFHIATIRWGLIMMGLYRTSLASSFSSLWFSPRESMNGYWPQSPRSMRLLQI